MAVLIRAAAIAVALAGCYDPSLRDCTVTCHAAGDCASGQVCGDDGYCAAPAVAGTCTAPDARASAYAPASVIDGAGPDAGPADAALAQLHVTVTGKGTVTDSTGTRSCSNDCLFPANPGDAITLTAVGNGGGHPFQDWTTANCMGMGATCTVTIVAPVTTVSASFK